MALQLSTKSAAVRRRTRWFEKLMAAIALLNLGLVLFDLSYIPLRDFYFEQFPRFTRWYGEQFKGIEPNRDTETYLQLVSQLNDAVVADGMSSPQVANLLRDLRTRSSVIIDENPFEVADKSGTLERIKLRMRDHMQEETGREFDSAKQAFSTFWSQDYLSRAGYTDELTFFNNRISSLMATNYYRSIGLDGRPANYFIKIDIWFIAIFAAEFLLRTFILSRRYRDTSWLDAVLWRWYDFPLLIPFSLFAPSWGLLRIIPVITRINQSNLIDLEPARNRLTRFFVASIAVELTEIVILRVIDQIQNLVRQGDISRALLKPDAGARYIDLNDIDEIQTISHRLVSTLVYETVPKVKPDIEAVLHHAIAGVLKDSPVYSGLQRLPGLSHLPDQLTQQVAERLYETAYGTLTHSLEDQEGSELTRRLIDNLVNTFRAEIQKKYAVDEIEALVNVWLDEVKINYIKRLAAEDVNHLREQSQKLYHITQSPKK